CWLRWAPNGASSCEPNTPSATRAGTRSSTKTWCRRPAGARSGAPAGGSCSRDRMRPMEELDRLREQNLLRSLEPLRSPPGAEIELRPGERLINFSSNDYLSLAGDARIAEALAEGARRWGAGAGASRLVCGDFLPQHELEEE